MEKQVLSCRKKWITSVAVAVVAACTLSVAIAGNLLTEDFNGTAGADLTTLGWSKDAAGSSIVISDNVIYSGQSGQYVYSNNWAEYTKALPGGVHTLGANDRVEATCILYEQYNYNLGGISVDQSNGAFWRIYRNENTHLWMIYANGSADSVEVPISGVFNRTTMLKIVATTTGSQFYASNPSGDYVLLHSSTQGMADIASVKLIGMTWNPPSFYPSWDALSVDVATLPNEDFDGTTGADLTSLGWTKDTSGSSIVLSDFGIQSGQSAKYVYTNNWAEYWKTIAPAYKLDANEAVEMRWLTYSDYDYNLIGAGFATSTGAFWRVYRDERAGIDVWKIYSGSDYAEVPISPALKMRVQMKIVAKTTGSKFWARNADGSTPWILLYTSSQGVPDIAKMELIGMDWNAPYSSLYWDHIRWVTNRGIDDSLSQDRGERWIRLHPFTLMSWYSKFLTYLNVDQYKGSELNSIQLSNSTLFLQAKASGLMGHFLLDVDTDLTPEQQAVIQNQLAPNTTDDNAWYVRDEPPTEILPAVGRVSQWLSGIRPYSLVYVNCGTYPNYHSYLDSVMETVKPDVLSYDYYPFLSGGVTDFNGYFHYLMDIRNEALEYRVPFFSWMQSFGRLPSESEMRMELFSTLAAGGKGLGYFCYDSSVLNGGFLNVNVLDESDDDTNGPMYLMASVANAEVLNLGKSLRFLENTDVRFVPGWNGTGHNTPYNGLSDWSPGAGSDPHITSVATDITQVYPDNNGLIGLFTDDYGERYFMLTNTYSNASSTAGQCALRFTITFDSSVNQLLRLNRQTGLQEVVALTNHTLTIDELPGGTGDLFKYNTGAPFAMGGPSISGHVSLQDYSGGTTGLQIVVELRKQGGGTTTRTVALDAGGNYLLNDVEAGTYDLAYKASHWLRSVRSGVVVGDSGNVPGQDVSLINGDCNGDNSVTTADAIVVLSALDGAAGPPPSANWDPAADLDGDLVVTSTDLSVVLSHLGTTGAP